MAALHTKQRRTYPMLQAGCRHNLGVALGLAHHNKFDMSPFIMEQQRHDKRPSKRQNHMTNNINTTV